MTMYRKDTTIPSHGRRAKADNAGTVRVKISKRPGTLTFFGKDDFDLFLNINPAAMTYNATAEKEQGLTGKRLSVSVDVPSELLERIVRLAQNRDFMSIKNEDIFPDMAMLDGNHVEIKVKTDTCGIALDSNMLEDTLHDGCIHTSRMNFVTPFNLLADLAYKALGINPFEDCSILVD